MFEAYSAGEVGFKLPVELCSIRCQKSTQNVLAGCKEGHLLVYSRTDARRKFDLKTLCKNFERKPVTEMTIIDSMQLLFCVSDQQLSVHELRHHSSEGTSRQDPYPLLAQLKIKPVHTFVVHENTEDANVLVMVSVKRKLQLFKYEKNEFVEIQIVGGLGSFADNPTALTWCGKSVMCAVRNEYHLITMTFNDDYTNCTAEARMIANFSDAPFILYFQDKDLIGLARGDTLAVLDEKRIKDTRNPVCKEIRFSNTLVNAVYDPPFVVGLLGKGLVEVRSFEPVQLVQSITLKQAHLITNALPGCVVVASHIDIWMLDCQENLSKNVKFLIQERNYKLAIEIVEQFETFNEENRREIKRQYARHLFTQKQFEECFDVFAKVQTEPLTAIQLIPEIIPEKFQNLQQSPPPALDLPENEKKRAISALSDYLSQVRTDLARKLEAHTHAKQMGISQGKLSKEDLQTTKGYLLLVDTTLLRCYLRTRPTLVDSLLRLRDNCSSFDETEEILKKANRLASLFILYETRKKHEMALELLKAEAHRPDPDPFFEGVDRTVSYLQTLGNAEIDLIFKYGKWVLDTDVREGLAIFTSSDSDLAINLDREKVVEFLRKECVAALIPYLEHIINAWGEQRPKFHECLAEHYVAKVKYLHKDYIHAFPDDENITRAGTEDGELGEYRRKLLKFLESSHSYSPQTILVQLSNQAFYEERALMLGRLGQHEQALTIYTSILHDYEAAERYCDVYYQEEQAEGTDSQIYLQLFQAFVCPKDPQIAGLSERQIPIPKPNVKQAIRVLSRHADKINTVSALNLIPESTPLCFLSTAISAVLQTTNDESIRCSIRRKVCECAVHVAEEQLRKAESVKVIVNNSTECAICQKRIANSALVRDPLNSQLTHVFCYEKSLEATPCDNL